MYYLGQPKNAQVQLSNFRNVTVTCFRAIDSLQKQQQQQTMFVRNETQRFKVEGWVFCGFRWGVLSIISNDSSVSCRCIDDRLYNVKGDQTSEPKTNWFLLLSIYRAWVSVTIWNLCIFSSLILYFDPHICQAGSAYFCKHGVQCTSYITFQ